jgi:hypothetical protein
MLDREEYVEQAYFFRTLRERMAQNLVAQELIESIRDELLATTKLPMALEFMASELRHTGMFAPAMARLPHYFTGFQTYLVEESEKDTGRFDFRIALEILEREAEYRARGTTPQGMFMYQFECLCRNRLGYDKGLDAMAADPVYDDNWRAWFTTLRRQVGIVDFADLIYVRSQYYVQVQSKQNRQPYEPEKPMLFGEKEGRIALANRRKDPLYLFNALQRQLGYPGVPRPRLTDESPSVLATLLRQVHRLDVRLKLLEDEQKGGIDITQFYGKSAAPEETS